MGKAFCASFHIITSLFIIILNSCHNLDIFF